MIISRGKLFALWARSRSYSPSRVLYSSQIFQVLPLWNRKCALKKKKNPKSKKTILETLLVLLFSWYYYFFNRHLLVIRHWHFDWWMQRCTQTWVCSHLLLQLLIAESSFIKWFASLLTRLEEMAIWTSWVSNLRSMSFIFLSTEGLAGK